VSVLVVGLSNKSAPVAILERAAVSGDSLGKLLRDVAQSEPVAEAFVVSTCNRVEVYADVDRFHAGVTAICDLLVRHCGVPADELTAYLYVHYEDRAVSHLMAVACGLDSVVVGEGQILGQVRSALKFAEDQGTMGRVLSELGRLALRTGKRARAETGIDRAGLSLLTVAIKLAAASAGTGEDGAGEDGAGEDGAGAGFEPLAGRDVLVVGAGSMSALAAATATRGGQPDPPSRGAAGRGCERYRGRARGPAGRDGSRGRGYLLHRGGRAGHYPRHGLRCGHGQGARGPDGPARGPGPRDAA
jgi:glutamyl-tRNA reductase